MNKPHLLCILFRMRKGDIRRAYLRNEIGGILPHYIVCRSVWGLDPFSPHGSPPLLDRRLHEIPSKGDAVQHEKYRKGDRRRNECRPQKFHRVFPPICLDVGCVNNSKMFLCRSCFFSSFPRRSMNKGARFRSKVPGVISKKSPTGNFRISCSP